jgi:NADH dehydrogenase
MKRVAILGGGFAGLSAAKILTRHRNLVDVVLLDRFKDMHLKPLLPDIISGTIPRSLVTYPIERHAAKYGFQFLQDEALEIALEKSKIRSRKETIPYDFLILAGGSETNFYGDEDLKRHALKLDDAEDAGRIARTLTHDNHDHYVIGGGGYTGVETATHIRKFLQNSGLSRSVVIVELSDKILGPLPDWMKAYCLENLKDLGIDIYLETKIEDVAARSVSLSNGKSFSNALLIWAAGMKAAEISASIDVSREAQGRLSVDDHLMFHPNAFAAGNTACFKEAGQCHRMSGQAAAQQGAHAARNIARLIKGAEPLEFKPLDMGYFVPMANWRSCGRFFGKDVTGSLGTFLHYLTSAYRAHGLKNKGGILWQALKNKKVRMASRPSRQ